MNDQQHGDPDRQYRPATPRVLQAEQEFVARLKNRLATGQVLKRRDAEIHDLRNLRSYIAGEVYLWQHGDRSTEDSLLRFKHITAAIDKQMAKDYR